ncbi:LysM peptidoglycan-binding domain-containing protein [uncultured Peptoniphilus sp.]|uniref:LysM peptidoglycan-binding domain-containing protein n=1 Tax=uncultured Peptoniphilus sp. TaxID=254354 RepID=UPI002803BDC6|nr:LysM peptidoglycan-binding domain-containing protein [uncultured Peptoniphilus sp.]
MKKRSIYLKKKRILTLLILMLLFTTGITTYRTENKEYIKPRYQEYIVKENDTMWKISSGFINSSTDIRNFISKVEEINNIDSQKLKPGMVIYMPIEP